jgi:trehalose/maltose hydrolase-like predicted phosphorylase
LIGVLVSQLAAEKAAEIALLKTQTEQHMASLSTNSHALMEGEAKAIETGEGELRRIVLLPSDTFGGHTSSEFHFRLAESQFLRMVGGASQFHVTKVEYIINPPLLKRYHDFKKAMQGKGEQIKERLTFHGTNAAAIERSFSRDSKLEVDITPRHAEHAHSAQQAYQLQLYATVLAGVDAGIPLRGASLGSGIYSSESPSFASQSDC